MVAVAISSMIATLGSGQNLVASAASNRELRISGTVGDGKVGYYTLGHIRQGGAVVVIMENVSKSNHDLYLYLIDMRSDARVGTGYIRSNGREHFPIQSDSDYMLEIHSDNYYNVLSYRGKIIIVN